MPIIYKGKIISPTMENPGCDKTRHGTLLIRSVDYVAHLESLWQSSTIHASKELMERFKDGETVVEGKDYEIKNIGRTRLLSNGIEAEYKVRIAVPLPAVEEGSQDEVRDKLRRELKEKFGFETGTVRRITAYLFNNYKLTKI